MNAIWIDEGQDADYTKLADAGIKIAYFSARQVPQWQLDAARQFGFGVGIYRAQSWDVNLSPAAWAGLVSQDVTRLGGDNAPLAVQADIELHDADWVKAFLAEYRRYRPTRATSWTLEGFQGGPWSWLPPIRDEIIAAKVTLVPQAYDGAMREFDSFGVVADLTEIGFPLSRIQVFYDAAKLKRGWDGFAFTQARLP